MACHRYLSLRFLGQRHAYGVANAVGQQGTNAYRTLDTSVLTLTGFCHAKVQRIVHILLIHLFDKQSHRPHHDHCVGSLDRDHHIVEMLFLADAQKLHAALHNTFRRVAIAVADTVRERTVVHANANGSVMLLADIQEGHKAVLYLLQFFGIFLIGVFFLDELTCRVDIVARIDTHLLGIERCHVSHTRIEMHVGDKRRSEAVAAYSIVNVLEILSFTHSLRGQSDEFSSCFDNAFSLLHASLCIIGVGGGHGLDAYRIVSSHIQSADMHHRSLAPMIVKQIDHIC